MAAMVGNLGDSVSWDTSHLATSRQSWHGGHVLQVITWWSIRENYHRWDDCRHEATHLARHPLAGRHFLTAQTQGRGHWPLVPPFLWSFPRGQWPFIRPPAASVVSLNLECHGEQEKSGGDLQRNGFNIKIVSSHLGKAHSPQYPPGRGWWLEAAQGPGLQRRFCQRMRRGLRPPASPRAHWTAPPAQRTGPHSCGRMRHQALWC